jgi:hypothetical protein
MEVEKFYLFLGYHLDEHEDVVAKSVTNAQMLENSCANSITRRLRQCGHLPGKDDDGTRVDRAGTIKELVRTQA